MGLAASQGRIMYLTARKSDIEFKVQIINQRRTVLAERSATLAREYANSLYQTDNTGTLGGFDMVGMDGYTSGDTVPNGTGFNFVTTDTTADPAISGIYEAQMGTIQALDKELELREKTLQTQNKEIETELDVVQKVIDKSIEKGFKTLG